MIHPPFVSIRSGARRSLPLLLPLAAALLSATAMTPALAGDVFTKTFDFSKESGLTGKPGEMILGTNSTGIDGVDGAGNGTGCHHYPESEWPSGAGEHSTCGAPGTDGGSAGGFDISAVDIANPVVAFKGSSDADHPASEPLINLTSTGGQGGDGGLGLDDSFRDGYGGKPGDGGNGGGITFSIGLNNTLDLSNYQHGALAFVSTGGAGGTGGEGDGEQGGGHGRDGGVGGNGGTVTVTLLGGGTVTTAGTGDKVAAIYAASKGGDGGAGGAAYGNFEHSTGGNGGDGGVGGAVSLTIGAKGHSESALTIGTTGYNAFGVVAQSHGGTGGDGGSAGDVWAGAHGGNASGSGKGGTVDLNMYFGSITTAGQDSDGILAQSIGGFGGKAGEGSGLIVAYGGDGESGGDAGNVTLDIEGTDITTTGNYSSALLAQSIGGGGGRAGSGGAIVGFGGTAGVGGTGGMVDVQLFEGTYKTSGVNSTAVRLSSIGGGGGSGGSAGGIVALGGSGSAGGNGGPADPDGMVDAVSLSTYGMTIGTTGDYSAAVELSSIGGGGGLAYNPGGMIAVGGKGGEGGEGRDVSIVMQSTSVTTQGVMSDGVFLQSVGGGGGKGAASFSLLSPLYHAVGGVGGRGGDGGMISSNGTSDNSIITQGFMSRGFVAQSVGGGGGTSGNSVNVGLGLMFNSYLGSTGAATGGSGGLVDIGTFGQITTSGDSSTGVFAQSVGGGGGAAGSSIEATVGFEFNHDLGTNGGAGGNGGFVEVDNKATITTSGLESDGIFAQSVGGGGGQSSAVVDATVGVSAGQYVTTQGASGGTGGNADKVNVTSSGEITTSGGNSAGILAQSIAGGGGKSGTTVDAGASIAIASSLGQTGGDGGMSGDVLVTNKGHIKTSGHLSSAILAQSIGGGGGQAGTTVNGDVGLDVNYTHGGNGGAGGQAGNVTVENFWLIETEGDGSVGILTQSIGGGGGNGGVTANGAISIASVLIGVGGNGGTGGVSGTVDVTNHSRISTKGNYASGILVNVSGGDGGNAGLLAQGSATGGEISGAVNVAVGGDGGTGGSAKQAKVTNAGRIDTSGYGSWGIFAQAIGGAGGSGGAVFAGNVNFSTEGGGSVDVTVGGSGGAGGQGGDVVIDNSGSITTTGHYADAIFAQSVGGNGGAGGLSYGGTLMTGTGGDIQSNVQVGGAGGDGAVGGNVKVTNSKELTTTGGNAHGIFAQSVGGSGGDGGAGYAFLGDFGREKENYIKVTANAQVGGFGGTGQDAGTVTVDNSGQISTAQDTSYGVYAQSVGGGGGDGGNAGAYSIGYTYAPKNEEGEAAEAKGVNLSYTMGGFGGGGGHGDTVAVSNKTGGSVQTAGTASYAMFAQSIGGSGGTGGNGEPDLKGWLADVYDVYEKINSVKEVYEQYKEFPKSLLEGFSVNVGGGAGDASNGGEVKVTNDGMLITTGSSGTAIYAQSVGGGGGSGGDGSGGLITSLTVAGSSGGGGNGGQVKVDNGGGIQTSGDGAMGIFAQSVGGGGGAAGDLETNVIDEVGNLWETWGSLLFGDADGGDGGDGGDVSITSAGSIVTEGKAAHGIWAHSVGGGGGAKGELIADGLDDDPGYIGSKGRKGNGGAVSISVDGFIDVKGEGSVGIIAQSASGGGESYSKGVGVTVKGTVRAEGKDGRAILAQASSYNKGHDSEGKNADEAVVSIDIAKGALVETTATDAYETVAIMGGRTVTSSDGTQIILSNTLSNEGTLRSADITSVVVRNDKEASLVITNDGGTFSGSVALDDANAQVFSNTAKGVAELGSSFDLGDHAKTVFKNEAVMTAGNMGAVATSTVTTGTFTQGAGAIYQVDATRSADGTVAHDKVLVNVHGQNGKVSLAGTIQTNWLEDTVMTDGHEGLLSVLSTTGGGNVDITGLAVANTATVSYSLANMASNTMVQVNYKVDYSGKSSGVQLSENSRNFATYYSNAILAIDNASAPSEAEAALRTISHQFLNASSGEELERRYTAHSTGQSLTGATAAIQSSQALHSLLQSCPTLDPDMGEDFFRQRDCVWLQAIGNRHHQSQTSTTAAFREVATGLAGAIQKEVVDDTFIEVGGQIEYLDVTSAAYGQSGMRFSAGMALKHEIGPFTLSTTLGGGTYDLDQSRRYAVGATGHLATADVKGRFLTAEGRVSAVFERHGFYAKPSVALSVTRLWQDAFSESGTGPLNWTVDSVTKTSVVVAPGLEVGHAFDLADRPTVAFLRAGLNAQLTDPSVSTTAVLAGVDASLGGLTSTSSSDRMRATFAAGFDMDVSERFSVSLLGQAGLSENTTDIGGHVRAKLRF